MAEARQADLFAPAPAARERRCGACVKRNARTGRTDWGHCAATGRDRHRGDPPCERWFGLEQLRKPLYGGKKR